MTHTQLREIELLRRIEIFQNAVIENTLSETTENTYRLDVAREDLSDFILSEKQKMGGE